MKIKYLFTVLLLALAIPAAAEFRTIQRAYEVDLNDLRLPQTDGGTIAFKACKECAFQTTRVAAGARWILNGRDTTLTKFREGLAAAENRDDATVTVLHHLENDRVTKVTVTIR